MWTINHQQINEQGRLKGFVENYPQLDFTRYADPLSSHALVLHGQEPANLLLYSEHLIRRILCDNNPVDQEPCGRCEACLAYLKGNSERFIQLFPQGAAITIAQVREMIAKLDLKLEVGKKQIVVLYFPAQMQKEAANALADDVAIDKKYINALAKIYHKQNFAQFQQQKEEIEDLYESIVK